MKRLAIAMAIGSVIGCSGCGASSPAAPAPPANVAASYDATVTASSACSANLPTETRALKFLANMAQAGTAVQVQLIAKAPGVPETSFSGTVSGQTVTFPSFSFPSDMGRGAALAASGSANVSANGLSITGTLSGAYQTPSGSSCNAANHQLEMVKLCLQQTSNGTAMLPCQQ